jgi:hypothetical protein
MASPTDARLIAQVELVLQKSKLQTIVSRITNITLQVQLRYTRLYPRPSVK